MLGKLQRLSDAGIQLVLADISTHFVFERAGFIAFVEKTSGNGFGQIGNPGLLTDHGFATLVWRGADAFFVARGYELQATPDQVQAIRRFVADLEQALTH